MRNNRGRTVLGDPVDTDFAASIQPISFDDLESPAGGRSEERLRIFIPEPNALAPIDRQTGTVDSLLISGLAYNVEQVLNWRGSHTRVDVIRGDAIRGEA